MSYMESTYALSTLTVLTFDDPIELVHGKDDNISIIDLWVEHLTVVIEEVGGVRQLDSWVFLHLWVCLLQVSELIGVDRIGILDLLLFLTFNHILYC